MNTTYLSLVAAIIISTAVALLVWFGLSIQRSSTTSTPRGSDKYDAEMQGQYDALHTPGEKNSEASDEFFETTDVTDARFEPEKIPERFTAVKSITWNKKPKLLDDLGLVFSKGDTEQASPKYFSLGITDEGAEIIMMQYSSGEMHFGPEKVQYLIKYSDEDYRLLLSHAGQTASELQREGASENMIWSEIVKFDEQLVAHELYAGTVSVISRGRVHALTPLFSDPFIQNEDRSKQQLTPGRAGMFTERNQNEMPVVQDMLYKQLPASLQLSYMHEFNFMKDDRVPNVVWNDGTLNTASYRFDGLGGCGGGGSVAVARNPIQKGEVMVVGKTATGENVYGLTSTEHPIVAQYFGITNGKRYEWNAKNQTNTTVSFTPAEYLKDHGLFLYRDSLGRWTVFSSNVYGPTAECGKPVIYLYPEKKQPVSVRVAADLTVVIPEYPKAWDVVAHPDGQLDTPAGKYPYLYWEGFGHGVYPTITRGVIVPHAAILPTLRAHMTQLGLNAQEQKDFLEFWLSRMPETPYVRLSWLGTEDMNELAPLTIVPKPNTVIRVFLDFEGVEKPYSLKPQVLSSVPRKGFTVIEWGGLLRGSAR